MSEIKSKITAIKEFFENCPLLNGDDVGVDQLAKGIKDFTVNPYLTSNTTLKRYTDGIEIKQYPFYFQSVETYSLDDVDTEANASFFEKLSNWIDEQNREMNFPKIAGIQRIETISDGYLIDSAIDVAVYQIQCRVVYLKT